MTQAPPPATPPLPPALCRHCRRLIDAAFAFCPHCGHRQSSGTAWYHDPIWIIVLALFVLGPFALPLVIRSRRMSIYAKLFIGTIVVLYGFITVYYGYVAISAALHSLRELNDAFSL